MKILSIEKGMNLSGYVYCFKSLTCLVSTSCMVSHIANENEKKTLSFFESCEKILKRESGPISIAQFQDNESSTVTVNIPAM